MGQPKTIALFPEASYGAALNCVGIAQALRARGARPVFICHPGFSGIFAEYGFAEYQLEPANAGVGADWNSFIEHHREAFRQPPLAQLGAYVAPVWEAIVETAIQAEAPLRQLLARLKPDLVVLDNVVMFPAVARAGAPWVRVISCAETELPDPLVPPYLSGCGAVPGKDWEAFADAYQREVAPAHRRFAAFMAESGLKPPPAPLFLPPSPWLNLLLAPEIVRHHRAEALDPARFQFLNGCVRQEAPFAPPRVAARDGDPLVLVSFGSLGAMDVPLIKRMFGVFTRLPCRFLVNVGAWRDEYDQVPDNVLIASWFPQPSVVAQASLFIHHGGNNSFCEALYFGVPSLVMPYCWDGHDNAARAEEVGVGRRLPRYNWRPEALEAVILALLRDAAMQARLRANATLMQAADGAGRAAKAILDLVSG